MAIDTATNIRDMNPDIPLDADPRSEGAGQIRAHKRIVQDSFPNVGGPVTATDERMNEVFTNHYLTIGCIMMFSANASGDIPTGWASCDGTSYTLLGGGVYQTPDMRNKFIKGSHPEIPEVPGTPIQPSQPIEVDGDLGGAHFIDTGTSLSGAEHVLSETEMPAHTHEYQRRDTNINTGSGSSTAAVESSEQTGSTGGGLGHSHGIITDALASNQPEYYIVTYIVFVGAESIIVP